MLIFKIALIILILCNIPITAAHAHQVIAIGLDKDSNELANFQGYLGSEGHTLRVLNANTKAFENENTYVQLYHPETNLNQVRVANRDTYIVLTPELDYNRLMEALIKIRAAKTFGARDVYVYSRIPIQEIRIIGDYSQEIGLESFLAIAGADFINESGIIRTARFEKLPKSRVFRPGYWVGGSNHLELRDQISEWLYKSPYSFEDLQANKQSIKGRKVYWVAASTIPTNEYFFTTLAQVHWLARNGVAVHLVSPYLPYARSDKPEQDVGVTTQGRLIADLIEGVGTQGITVVRAHAPQSLGFFTIFSREVSGRATINHYLKSQGIECVLSPDAGFQKDATKYTHDLIHAYGGKDVCLAVMNKKRDTDGKESLQGGTSLELLKDKKVVIIDDETASGGTLAKVAEYIQDPKYRPKEIIAVVTHLAGYADKALDSKFLSSVVVTNTVPISAKSTMSKKLVVIPIAKEIASDIHEIEKNRH